MLGVILMDEVKEIILQTKNVEYKEKIRKRTVDTGIRS